MSRQNILVLGVGKSNTTITTRQLEALGWNLGPVDQYAECVAAREVNEAMLSDERRHDGKAASAALSSLPQPWALKDPRFAQTAQFWLPAFAPYRPFLLWVDKPRDEVVASLKRENWYHERELEDRIAGCERIYKAWPWGKLKLQAHDIASACALFDTSRTSPVEPKSESAIPKKMHRIWVGDDPLPSEHAEWIEKWAQLHPQWEQRLWKERDIERLVHAFDLDKVYRESPHLSYKSDVARYCILFREGGIYMDTDFRPIKPIDPLLAGCRAFVSAGGWNPRMGEYACGGFIGAVAGHPFLQEMIRTMKQFHNPAVGNAIGPPLVDYVVKNRADVRVFERPIFIGPQDYYGRDLVSDDNDPPESYAVHHWSASWVK